MPFPDPRRAGPPGLVAVGGELTTARLLEAYSKGIFPWYEKEPILWFSPDPRMVLLPDQLHLSRSLRRTMRRGLFELRLDTAFEQVIRACAAAPRVGQHGTWLNRDMMRAYGALHDEGYAHSAEAWRKGKLVGGLYGVSLGGVFYGESMFTRETDASKVALAGLVEQIRAWGFALFDCQIHTPHTERFGATEWDRDDFLDALPQALRAPTRRGQWSFDERSAADER